MKTLTKLFVCLLVMAGVVDKSRGALITEGNLQAVLDLQNQSPPLTTGFITSNGIPNVDSALMGGVWQAEPTNSARLTNNPVYGPSIITEPGGTLAILFGGDATNALTLFTANQQNGGTNIWLPSTLGGVNPHYSVEAWVLAPVLGAYSTIVSWGTTSASSNQFVFGYGASDGNVGGALNQGANTFNWGAGGPPQDGVYHHLVATFDGTTTTLYCDGVAVNSSAYLNGGTSFAPLTTFPINIGSTRANGGGAGENGAIATGQSAATGHARMHIAKVRIMDGVLTPSDVLNNYNTDKATYQLTPSLLSHAPIHRYSFNVGQSPINGTAVVNDTGTGTHSAATVYTVPGSGLASFTGTKLHMEGGSPTNGAFVDLGTNLISSLSTYATNNASVANGLTPGMPGYNSSPGTGTGQVSVEGWLTVKGHPNFWQTYFAFGAVTATNTTNATLGTTVNVSAGKITGLAMVGQAGPGGLTSGANNFGQLTAANGGYGGINMWLFQQNNEEPTSTKMDLNGNADYYYGGYSNTLATPAIDDSWYSYAQNQDFPFTMTYYACTWDEPSGVITTYINGLPVSRNVTQKKFFMIYDRNCWLGRDLNNANPTLEGDYQEFRIYSNVLSAGEVLGNFQVGPTVLNTSALGTVSATHINLTTSSTSMVGQHSYFTITADYSGGASGVNVSADAVSLSVDDPTVIALTSGMMQFLKPGTTAVHATFGGQTANLSVTVSPLSATMTHRFSFNQSDSFFSPFDSVGFQSNPEPGYPVSPYGYVGSATLDPNGANVVIITNASPANSSVPGWIDFGPNFLQPGTYDGLTVEMWASFGAPGSTAPLFSFGDQRINAAGVISNLNNNGAPNGALPMRGRYFIEGWSRPNAELIWSADDAGVGSSGVNQTVLSSSIGALDNQKNAHIVAEYNPTGGFARIYVNGVPTTQTNDYLPLVDALVDNYNYIGLSVNSGNAASPPGAGPAGAPYAGNGQGTEVTNNMVLDEFRTYNGILAQSNVVIDLATGPDLIVTSPGTLESITLITSNSVLVSQTLASTLSGTFQNVTNVNLFLYDTNSTISSSSNAILSVAANGNITGVSAGTAYVIASYGAFAPVSNLVTVVSITPVLAHEWSFNTNSSAGGSNWDSIAGVFNATNMGNAYVTNGHLVLTTNGPGASTDYETLPQNIIDSSYIVLSLEAWASFTNHSGTNNNYSELWSFGTTNSSGNSAYYMNFTPHSATAGPFSFVTFTSQPAAPNAMLDINGSDPGATAGANEIDAFGTLASNPSLANPLDHQANVQIVGVFHPFGGYMQLYTNGVLAGTNTLSSAQPNALQLLEDAESYLGRGLNLNSDFIDGTIDEFRIYHGLLGAQQVAMDYATGPNSIVSLSAPNLIVAPFGSPLNLGNVFVSSISMPAIPNMLVDGVQATPAVFGAGSNSINQTFTGLSLQGGFITNATSGGLDAQPTFTSSSPGVVQIVNGKLFARQPGTTTITATYVAENTAYNGFNSSTASETATATITVGYSPGPVQIAHRYSFNEPTNTTVDHDSVGGIDATNHFNAQLDGHGHLLLDGGIQTNIGAPWDFSYARTGPGLLAGLSNATFEAWITVSNNTPYTRIFDTGADVDSTVSAADTNGLTNCYVALVTLYGAGSPIEATIKPTNSGIQYDVPFVIAGGLIYTNGTEEQIDLVWDQAAGQGLIYTNGILSSTNSSPMNAMLSNVHDESTYFGRSHYIATNQNTGVNGGTTDPPLAGSYDEFRVWNAAMSSNEVLSSYLLGPNQLPSPALKFTTNGGGGFLINYPYYATRTWTLATSSSPTNAVSTWTPVATTPVTNVVAGVLSTITVPVTPSATQQYYILK